MVLRQVFFIFNEINRWFEDSIYSLFISAYDFIYFETFNSSILKETHFKVVAINYILEVFIKSLITNSIQT